MCDCNIYLTDKTGKRFWNTWCGYGFHQGELRNQERRFAQAREGKYKTVDADSVQLVMVVGELGTLTLLPKA
jgi:hypothetical protein